MDPKVKAATNSWPSGLILLISGYITCLSAIASRSASQALDGKVDAIQTQQETMAESQKINTQILSKIWERMEEQERRRGWWSTWTPPSINVGAVASNLSSNVGAFASNLSGGAHTIFTRMRSTFRVRVGAHHFNPFRPNDDH